MRGVWIFEKLPPLRTGIIRTFDMPSCEYGWGSSGAKCWCWSPPGGVWYEVFHEWRRVPYASATRGSWPGLDLRLSEPTLILFIHRIVSRAPASGLG